MNTLTQYRYTLDRSSRKYNCPQCREKRFTKVIDNETKEYLPDHVGRCDRENRCGYNYTWAQFIKEGSMINKPFLDITPVEEKPIEYIPLELVEQSIGYYDKNNLVIFLKQLFSHDIGVHLCKEYVIGTSKHWPGANIYWQIDEQGQARQAKIMLYNPSTGKRVKDCSKLYGRYLPGINKDINLEQCFFGQHLLAEYPDKPVCVVESEKTALIASIYLPDNVWIATGAGLGGCKWREYSVYKVLKGRTVTFFPDYGYANKQTGLTCYSEWCERVERIREVLPGQIRVSDLLEKRLKDKERNDEDIADLLLNHW
jgi:hypothetical protein